jgi:ribosome-associated translation inhibitor RaiA
MSKVSMDWVDISQEEIWTMQDDFSEKRSGRRDEIKPQQCAVLIVDMLNDFFKEGGAMVLEGGEVLYEPIERLANTARRLDMPVFWLNQTLPPDDTLFKKRVVHCLKGSWGAEVVEDLTKVVDKYQRMQVFHAHIRFHEHKEKLRGTPLIRSEIRLRTSEGQVAGSGEGYGADHAFHVALDRLERNVLELKGVTADEEYRGQLLRKLGEL